MQPPLTDPCKTCDGTGRVPRPRRRLPNGEIDQFDTLDWPEVICEVCTGTGRVPADLKSIPEKETAA